MADLEEALRIDFLPRQSVEGVPHPFRFSATGRMALRHTITPAAFVEFKRWMAKDAPLRDEAKRRRDRLQADTVQELLDQKLLVA